MSSQANLQTLQQLATDVTFDVLIAAAEAAAWAVTAAYPEHVLDDPRAAVDPPRNPVEAAQHVVLLADRIRDAVDRYRLLVELGLRVPEAEQEELPF